MRNISLTILLIISSGLAIGQANKGFEISFRIDGLSDSTVYLAYHLGDKQYLKDSVRLDKTGHGLFSGKESLPQGIYMIVLPLLANRCWNIHLRQSAYLKRLLQLSTK